MCNLSCTKTEAMNPVSVFVSFVSLGLEMLNPSKPDNVFRIVDFLYSSADWKAGVLGNRGR
jgi:hypothetical protein